LACLLIKQYITFDNFRNVLSIDSGLNLRYDAIGSAFVLQTSSSIRKQVTQGWNFITLRVRWSVVLLLFFFFFFVFFFFFFFCFFFMAIYAGFKNQALATYINHFKISLYLSAWGIMNVSLVESETTIPLLRNRHFSNQPCIQFPPINLLS
jgi:hypothetical protein